MNTASTAERDPIDRILAELRPKLHRYCARMTGSVIDGEDVVQDALMKAIEALPAAGTIDRPEGWLFRIAHNAALDFLRRRARQDAIRSDEDPDMVVDPATTVEDRQEAAASLRTFMRLPIAQRSSVILMDVLGYSLDEIGDVTASSIPSVKAALHRGRTRLRAFASEPDDHPAPALPDADRARLAQYVEHFNGRNFEAIRDLLAEEVRLEVVNRTRMNGRREMVKYFGNYAAGEDWHLAPGLVEGRPAAIVHDPRDPSGTATYFILLDWSEGGVAGVRDFRYARYAIEAADIVMLPR